METIPSVEGEAEANNEQSTIQSMRERLLLASLWRPLSVSM